MIRMKQRVAYSSLLVSATVGALTISAGICAAAIQGVTFSVNTDKKVYYTYEPIRVEVDIAVSTDTPPSVDTNPARYSLASVSVYNVSTKQYVANLFNLPLTKLTQSLPPNAQVTFGVVDIAAYQLTPGKYNILTAIVLPLICTTNPTSSGGSSCPPVYTNASTTITVR